jgi:hypothetical protein
LITPFGLASVAAARALPLRLLFAADVFAARFDRFFAIASLPFLSYRHQIHERRPHWPDGDLSIMVHSVAIRREINHSSSVEL